ncbi:histidine phosphatase family protein [Pacificoceanicola onchidii]|uniref:histidine phosphatase family protein n=1 Tax=Pacificoceanicola onchidii TaxID=2562685 RepID=UPI0010A49342|nr:histidine phosphatase family protein [Pacificoceanicola onchidii]
MRRRHFLALSSATLLAACATGGGGSLAPNSTIIITRHAERSGEDLNDAGRARAQLLVSVLADTPLDAIHSPGIQRNLDTAAPLLAARGLEIERIAQENPTPRLTRSAAGRTVIWVGNKGNIAQIWEDLALPGNAPLEYGDLVFIRSDAAGNVTVERQTY